MSRCLSNVWIGETYNNVHEGFDIPQEYIVDILYIVDSGGRVQGDSVTAGSHPFNSDSRISSVFFLMQNVMKCFRCISPLPPPHIRSDRINNWNSFVTLGPLLIGRFPDLSNVIFSSASHCSNKSRISSSCKKTKLENVNRHGNQNVCWLQRFAKQHKHWGV